MTIDEMAEIMDVMEIAYPAFYARQDESAKLKAMELWATMFADEPAQMVAMAVKAFIASDTKGFPPGIGQIKTIIGKMTMPKELEMTELEAWTKVRRAIRGASMADWSRKLGPDGIGPPSAVVAFEALPELLQTADALDFRVNITTNGTLLPQRSKLLAAAPAVRKVSISLHSQEASADRRWEGYLEHCIDFARQAAVGGKIIGLRLWNLERGQFDPDGQNAPVTERLRRAFPGEWVPVREGFRLAERIFLEYGERFTWPDWEQEAAGGQAFCYGLRDQFGVLCDGTVVPCCLDHDGDLALGNLFDRPLEEILSSPRATAIYEGFSRRRAAEDFCRRCGYARRFLR